MGPVWGFDLAVRTGFCVGRPRSKPRSGTVILGKHGERATVLGNFVYFLQAEWTIERPSLVVVEDAIALEAFRDRSNSQDRVKMDYGLHGVLEAMCNRFAVRLEHGNQATVRKHFIGVGRVDKKKGEDVKVAVTMRCHQLGYFGRDVWDDNRADACATWDWGCAVFCRAPPRELHLYGEERRG